MTRYRNKLTRMAGFTLGALLAFAVGTLAVSFLPGSLLGIVQDLGALGLIVSLAYYTVLGSRWLLRKLFWKVRNRIIVSYAFAGIIPVLLLAAIALSVIGLILMRVAGFFLEGEMSKISVDLQGVGVSISQRYLREWKPGRPAFELLEQIVKGELADIPVGYQRMRVEVLQVEPSANREAGNRRFRLLAEFSGEGRQTTGAGSEAPGWIADGFSGLTLAGRELRFTQARDLDETFRIVLLLPFDTEIENLVRDRTSMEILVTDQSPETESEGFLSVFADFRSKQSLFALNWSHVFRPLIWASGVPTAQPWLVLISMKPRTLLIEFFAQNASVMLSFIMIMGGGLVLVELISVAVGFVIARRVTSSIHDIYVGTERIQSGDFNVRIPSRDRDQLDAMATSFNQMSASITRLMNQASEREAIEKELEIAKEVQAQLFPAKVPSIEGLEVAASCHAARQVSGDYFDFLTHGDGLLDVVVGDISGKGISAALLMASTQATIRSGLMEPLDGEDPCLRMARVVRDVNRQLYRRSSPESYSTLVLAQYDAHSKLLVYCNAGHHPPLVFSDGQVNGLTVGGTVVGLFENWNYEGGRHQLTDGDLVVFFTDGVVEAANAQGEQFGTERVVETVGSNTFLTADDIQNLILEQVYEWSRGEEQGDDITVVCLKVCG